MRTIEYQVTYSDNDGEENVKVQARDINAGYAKVLKRAREPLGNGRVREICKVEFSAVLS